MLEEFEHGIVQWFNRRPKKRHGFINSYSRESIYFRGDNAVTFSAIAKDQITYDHVPGKDPRPGDEVVFLKSRNEKGLEATAWGFANDYELASKKSAYFGCIP